MSDRSTGVDESTSESLVGTVLAGRYRLLDVIARGGMGRIYKAEQQPLGRMVAVKVLSVRFGADEDPAFEDRFFLEASTLARLKHPNTVTVFDYGHEGETWYMAMEFVEGVPLSRVLRSSGPLDPARALRLVYQVARSLTEAHEHGIIHRDLKPSNIMVVQGDEGESVKVLDFGIAKVLEDWGMEDLTRPDRMVGSPRYMAPEQIVKQDLDGRTDLYALGVMLYELLTGHPPFKGESSVKTLMAHVNDPVPPMKTKTDRSIPVEVEQLVRRCLQKKPDNRFPDVRSFKTAVRAVLVDLGSQPVDTREQGAEVREALATRERASAADSEAGGSTRRWLIALFVVLMVILFGASVGAGWLVFRTFGPSPPADAPATEPAPR